MKIIKNTSGRDTRAIKRVFTIVHNFMKSPACENRPAPNWKNLRVQIGGRDRNYHSGRAYYWGRGVDWDVHLTIPYPERTGRHWADRPEDKGKPNLYRVRTLAWLIYHELMHTYGYKHSEYQDIRDKDLVRLFPENYEVPATQVAPKAAASPQWRSKYDRLVARRKSWLTKQKRAKNALAKIDKSLAYYRKTYGIED